MNQQSARLPSVAVLVVIVLALVVALNAIATWHQATFPWLYLHQDHKNLGPIYFKSTNPALYSRDYLFHNNRYFQFYTPSFLSFVRIASSIAGDYFHGLALLQVPILAAYLVAAYALFWQVSRNSSVALMVTLFSLLGLGTIIDTWGVTGLYYMLPRTIALPALLLAVFLWVRFFSVEVKVPMDGRRRWHWLLLGLLLGGIANLHPTTGITVALVIGVVTLVHRTETEGYLWKFSALVIGTALAATPIIVNVFGERVVSSESTIADFQAFAAAFQERVFILPAPIERLAYFTNDTQYLIAFTWLPITLFLRLLSKGNRRSIASVLFVVVQLGYAWHLVRSIDEGIDALVFIIAAIFFIWRWWVRDEQREMLFFDLIAAIVGVSFFLVFVLRFFWLNLEVWSLTTLAYELPRGARLFTIAFTLIGARFAVSLGRSFQSGGQIWLQALTLLSVVVPLSIWHTVLIFTLLFWNRIHVWQQARPTNTALWAGVLAFLSVYLVGQTITRQDFTVSAIIASIAVTLAAIFLLLMRVSERHVWPIILVGAAVVIVILTALDVISPINIMNDSPWYTTTLRGVPDFVTFLLGGMLGLGAWLILKPRLFPQNFSNLASWLSLSLIVVITIQSIGLVKYSLKANSEPPPPIIQAALWARANTDHDALFFDTFYDGSTFRFWSLRSITHGSIEQLLIPFSYPADFIPILERHRRIVAASEDAIAVQNMANELNVDYIIRDKDMPLNLPIVYSNDALIIYRYVA